MNLDAIFPRNTKIELPPTKESLVVLSGTYTPRPLYIIMIILTDESDAHGTGPLQFPILLPPLEYIAVLLHPTQVLRKRRRESGIF